jgi:voltage-gated sodium channel
VLYIYAIIAMNTFKENNPWHYRSLPISILSLFRAATLVDWAKIAYIDILGCDKSSDSVYAKSNSVEGLDPFWYCTSPSTSYIVGPFFWSSFIVVSSLVMLSLFIGSITVAMSDSMNKLRDDERRENKHHRLMEKLASQSNIDRTSMDETISGRRR